MELILASNSNYKRTQLSSLGITFKSINPNIKENHNTTITPLQLSVSLAKEKASALASVYPASIIIGSDQTAYLKNTGLLTKPGTRQNAIDQLTACSGNTVEFHSGICVMSADFSDAWSVTTQVTFRQLEISEITRYIDKDHPLDCAGSFKVESLGISLFENIRSDDPTALVGLPLISLARALRKQNILVP